MHTLVPPNTLDQRREFLGIAAAGVALAALGREAPCRAAPQPSASGKGSLGPLKQINAGPLDVGYVDAGPANAPVVLLLHGWPYDIHAFAEVVPKLVAGGYRVIVPHLRGFGTTCIRSSSTPRNAQQAALAADGRALLDALHIKAATVAGFDWGARTACIMATLWPERCKALVSVSGYLIGSQDANKAPLSPEAEHAWWYQFYFATDRGRAGYGANTSEFNKLIWRLASPRWAFSDQTYARSAESFQNPDHVDLVIHNYRWRLGLAHGEQQYDAVEQRLAGSPPISVPTITLEGDANGAPHPPPAAYAHRFTGAYQHRLASGGVGHNLPQEAPEVFAQAILDVGRL